MLCASMSHLTNVLCKQYHSKCCSSFRGFDDDTVLFISRLLLLLRVQQFIKSHNPENAFVIVFPKIKKEVCWPLMFGMIDDTVTKHYPQHTLKQ